MKNIILLFSVLSFFCGSAQTVGLIQHDANSLDDGYVLFAPMGNTTTYLIDKCGKQIKTWPSSYNPALSVYLLPDGTLLRTGNANNTTFNVGGKGGIIQKIDWNGNVTWTYTISTATKCQHHDVKALPNGNVLIIAWESKTNTEAISMGRNPNLVPATVWSEQIIEVQPTGLTTGTIVWEWHLWDHLIQDFDATKPNSGIVNQNPQLININYGASATNSDWIHLNSIDYNAELDQILVSSHSFDEVWIIDHSTTTAEAASHTGGNSGKGGDLLYRWGNPLAYKNGVVADKKLFKQHNAIWIPSEYPFEKQLMIFNNGLGRPGGNYSTVEIITPPVDGYTYTPTLPYLPTATSWNFNNENPASLYAQNISSSQMLSNGNVLVCNGPAGTFIEVNSSGETVWKYINPVTPTSILAQGATPQQNLAFRCTFYPENYSGFDGHSLVSGTTIENTNPMSNNCNLNLSLSALESNQTVTIYPNPANDFVTIEMKNSHDNIITVEIYDELGRTTFLTTLTAQNDRVTLNVEHLSSGIYFVKTTIGSNSTISKLIRS